MSDYEAPGEDSTGSEIRERGALPLPAFHFNVAAMILYKSITYGQPKPTPLTLDLVVKKESKFYPDYLWRYPTPVSENSMVTKPPLE